MAPMKRPASAIAAKQPAAKKAATARNNIEKKVKAVADTVANAEGFPDSVLRMLSANVALTLGVPKEERHSFQEQVCTMVGEVLAAVDAKAQEEIAGTKSKADEVAGSKATLEGTAQAATDDLAAKSAAADAAKTAVADAAAALKAAKSALATAETEQKAVGVELEAVASKKAQLESALADTFAPLRDGNTEDVKSKLAELVKVGTAFSFESSLMCSLPAALSKTPSSRGSFDTMVISQVEEEINKKIAGLTEALAAGEPGKTAAADKVSSASVELVAASERDASCKAELEAARAAHKEVEGALKTAQKGLKDFEPDMKKASKAFDAATANHEQLKSGPLAAYTELLELSNAPPPAVEEEAPAEASEAAPVEEAAAGAAAEEDAA